jgi:hypothetical protein
MNRRMNATLFGSSEGSFRFILGDNNITLSCRVQAPIFKTLVGPDCQLRIDGSCCYGVAYCSLSLPVLGKGIVGLFPLITVRQLREETHAYLTFVIAGAV